LITSNNPISESVFADYNLVSPAGLITSSEPTEERIYAELRAA
jgi:hypothetical protein